MCSTPSSFASREPCVPLPPPGGASISTFTGRAYRPRRAGLGHPPLLSGGWPSPTRGFPASPARRGRPCPMRSGVAARASTRPARARAGAGDALSLSTLPAVEQDEDDAADDGGEENRCGHCGHGLISVVADSDNPDVVDADAHCWSACGPATRTAFMALVDRYGPADAADRARSRAYARGRRGGRAGGVARRPAGPGPLRGPVVAEDVDPADRRQPRTDPRRARSAQRADVLARRRRRSTTSPPSTPTASCRPDHPRYPGGWASPAAQLGARCRRSACSPPRRSSRCAPRSPAPAAPTGGHRAARRRGLGARRRSRRRSSSRPGNQRVLLHRARAKVRDALERYFDGVARVIGPVVPGGISCRELVELVTAYLDGALAPEERARMERAPRAAAPVHRPTSSRSARPPGSRPSRRPSWSCGPDRDALLRAFRDFGRGMRMHDFAKRSSRFR